MYSTDGRAPVAVGMAIASNLKGKLIGTLVHRSAIMRVYILDEEDQTTCAKFAYRVLGPKGANYYLMRNKHDPKVLFALDIQFRPVARFNGIWFTDYDGELKIAS